MVKPPLTSERAGSEFARDGRISEEAQAAASVKIITREAYFKETNRRCDEALENRAGNR